MRRKSSLTSIVIYTIYENIAATWPEFVINIYMIIRTMNFTLRSSQSLKSINAKSMYFPRKKYAFLHDCAGTFCFCFYWYQWQVHAAVWKINEIVTSIWKLRFVKTFAAVCCTENIEDLPHEELNYVTDLWFSQTTASTNKLWLHPAILLFRCADPTIIKLLISRLVASRHEKRCAEK